MALTGKQRSYLRSLAHHLKPVVLTGDKGLTQAIFEKVVVELDNHELIKVRVSEGDVSTKGAAAVLAERSEAELVQVIGRMVVLYKGREEDPEIILP